METQARLRLVRRLGGTVVAMTFALMVLGSWVKATGSGLSCPDWPQCYGEWLPPFPSSDRGGTWDGEPVHYTQAQILYEWVHRFWASLLGAPFLAWAGLAATGKDHHRGLRSIPVIAGVVLLLQIFIGGLTVLTKNPAWATTWHLATATLFMVLVTWATSISYLRPWRRADGPTPFPGEVRDD